MARASNISLWEKFDDGHWLRSYGRTQVIVIDDQWYSDTTFEVPSKRRKELEKKLNITFHFFDPPVDKQWNVAWFSKELEKVKSVCKEPAAILLDLMFGEQKTPDSGSGKKFLRLLSEDDHLSGIPILIITAGREDRTLLNKLKTEGGSLQAFLEKYNPPNEPFSDRLEARLLEFALLSDPNINAYSLRMRKIAQEMRKIVIDPDMVEEIKGENIPKSVLFVGNSGDGKNFLAEYTHRISDRNRRDPEVMTFSDVSDPSNIEPALFGSRPFTGHQGNVIRIDSGTGQRSQSGDITLATVGMVTNADNGTLVLDELGNSPHEMQSKLFRFLDKREISPHLHSGYIPQNRPYNVWVLMTMQPHHSDRLKDLERRLNKMIRIDVPSLNERPEDIIPMAVHAVKPAMDTAPTDIFTDDALAWFREEAPDLTAGNLTALISNLTIETSKYPYNAKELDRAFRRLSKPAENKRTAIVPDAVQTGRIDRIEEEYRDGMLSALNLRTANYVLWALEKNKWNNKPQYPKTWHTITGEYIKNSSQCQRNIGNILFQISDEELAALMRQSEIFKEAVFTCGTKVQSAKKRLPAIKKLLDGSEK